MRDFTKKYFHLNSSAVYNSSAKNKSCIIDCIKMDNIIINDASEISNTFDKYFATIGLSTSTKGGNSKTSINEYLNKIPFQDKSVFLAPCSKSEIKKLIMDLPNKSRSGHDNVMNKLLKEIGDHLIDPLHHIFNLSISMGVFPDNMKLADISPLFKGGNRHVLNNYRPISLLPTISKLLEKLVYARTYNFLDQKNILYNSQYGFCKKHSCEHAVTEVTGEICKGLENGKHTLAMFIDLSKAFDTINHDILYKKMYRYGIHGTALDWYKSYLTDRYIRAKCNCSTTSHVNYLEEYKINIGTPQGSCLGPLIFLIFCNDLYLNLELCNAILFGDDTTIYKIHNNLRYLEWCMKSDLSILLDWFTSNNLSINICKSIGMLFSNKNLKMEKLIVGLHSFDIIDNTKFLGIWIDQKLCWKSHISKLISKINSNMNLLKLKKNFLNIHIKKMIYFAQIQSHLTYGLCIWGNMIPDGVVNKLQKFQNKCISLINGKIATPDNYKSLGIL